MNDLKEVKGDLLSVKRGIIVHGCNAQGIMGGGVAALIKRKWPRAYEEYCIVHKHCGLQLGQVLFVEVEPFLVVANMITQEGFSDGVDTDYDAIQDGFRTVAEWGKHHDLPIHYPKVGSGIGGGEWDIIYDIIQDELADMDHTLWVL